VQERAFEHQRLIQKFGNNGAELNTERYYRNTSPGTKKDLQNEIKTICSVIIIIYYLWLCSPARAMASSFTRFLDHKQRRATVGWTPLDEWSVRRRDLYLTRPPTTEKNQCPGAIRTHDRSRRAAVDLRLRPRGHWDRPVCTVAWKIKGLCLLPISCYSQNHRLLFKQHQQAGPWFRLSFFNCPNTPLPTCTPDKKVYAVFPKHNLRHGRLPHSSFQLYRIFTFEEKFKPFSWNNVFI
jgi:hypothetical protein